MKKRIFGMVLALVLVLGLVPVTAWATEAEEYEYYYFKDKNFPTTGNAYFTKDAPELPGVTWDQENEVLTQANRNVPIVIDHSGGQQRRHEVYRDGCAGRAHRSGLGQRG